MSEEEKKICVIFTVTFASAIIAPFTTTLLTVMATGQPFHEPNDMDLIKHDAGSRGHSLSCSR